MITGSVNAAGEPIVSLRVRGPDGRILEIDAVVDTGFNGLVALPPEQISSLKLPRLGAGRVVYGDGNEADLEVHQAVIEWDGLERPVRGRLHRQRRTARHGNSCRA